MEEKAQSGGGLPLWLKILGCGCLITLIGIGGCSYYVATNVKQLAVMGVKMGVRAGLEGSGIPQEEVEAVMTEVEGFGDDFVAGRVNEDQLQAVMTSLFQGPFMGVVGARAFEANYVQKSSLPEEEKQAADRITDRFARGLVERKIDWTAYQSRLEPIFMIDQGNGNKKLKERLSDDELRQAIAIMTEAVEGAGIPDEPFEIDLAAEVRRSIQEGMNDPQGVIDRANSFDDFEVDDSGAGSEDSDEVTSEDVSAEEPAGEPLEEVEQPEDGAESVEPEPAGAGADGGQ